MTTVASRTLRSSPHRDSAQTWSAVVELLTKDRTGATRNELLAISGIASSVIADRATQNAPIVVTCDGPRTRIYCLYDDDAVDGSDANEDALGFDPLQGDWRISLPCHKDDLSWVQAALKKHSSRVTARDLEAGISTDEDTKATKSEALILDPKGFLGS